MEEKDIEEYEDYIIDTIGRVYSKKSGAYLAQRTNKDGYLLVELYKNGVPSRKRVHRLVAIAFIPNPEDKPAVDHINRIRSDNRPENLRWATDGENNRNRACSLNNMINVEGVHKVYRNNKRNVYYVAYIRSGNKKATKYFPATDIGLIEAIAWRITKKQEWGRATQQMCGVPTF